jgi:hypothetical protein
MSQQNLTQFFKSANKSISNKRKPDVYSDHHETTITKKNAKYKDKRKRTFQNNWKKRFPWVQSSQNATNETESMYCHYCRSLPNIINKKSSCGTTNIRIEPLKSHDRSNERLICARKYLTHATSEQSEIDYKHKVLPAENRIFKVLAKLT